MLLYSTIHFFSFNIYLSNELREVLGNENFNKGTLWLDDYD